MTIWLKIAPIAGACLLGWWLGTNHVEGKWAKAENQALNTQIRLRLDAEEERDTLSAKTRNALLALSEAENEAVRLSDALQAEITRGPIIRMVETEDCSAVAVVDVARHYRLFNCGIGNSCQALSAPRIPD